MKHMTGLYDNMKPTFKDMLTLLGMVVGFAVSWGMLKAEVSAQTKDLLELKDIPAVVSAIRADQISQGREIAESRKDIRELRRLLMQGLIPFDPVSPPGQ